MSSVLVALAVTASTAAPVAHVVLLVRVTPGVADESVSTVVRASPAGAAAPLASVAFTVPVAPEAPASPAPAPAAPVAFTALAAPAMHVVPGPPVIDHSHGDNCNHDFTF